MGRCITACAHLIGLVPLATSTEQREITGTCLRSQDCSVEDRNHAGRKLAEGFFLFGLLSESLSHNTYESNKVDVNGLLQTLSLKILKRRKEVSAGHDQLLALLLWFASSVASVEIGLTSFQSNPAHLRGSKTFVSVHPIKGYWQ